MELLMDNVLALVATGLVVGIGVIGKLWNKSYKGFVPSDVIEEEAILEFLVKMAKEQDLPIEKKEDVDYLVEFGRLKLKDVGVHVDRDMLETVVEKVKQEIKK